MTSQADWVKSFDKLFEDGAKGTIAMYFDDGGWTTARVHHIKSFIQSQITLTQQRTEKKWRLKAKKLMKPTIEGKGDYTDFTTSTGTRDTLLQWSYNQALKDLLEE